MCNQFRNVLSVAKERELTLRMAAYILALQRIGAAAEAMGTAGFFSGGDR